MSLAEPSESDLCFDACVKTNKELLLTKVTKCCAEGESKRRLATFAFTGTAAINAEHLEHYIARRKKVKRLGAKTISFPKEKGHLTHNNREFISNNVVPERTAWNRIYIQESLE